MKKTNVVLIAGVLLIVIGYAALSMTQVSTLRACRTYSGYQINSISLTTIAYYDGCNWVSASSVALAVPIGVLVFAVGVLLKSATLLSSRYL